MVFSGGAFAAYQLFGAGYSVDANRMRVTGPLVSAGRDTGKIEIWAGGPAIGFQQVSAQMHADRSITFGMLALDEAIQKAKNQPVTGVVIPYDIDPLVIMWDPSKTRSSPRSRYRESRYAGVVLLG